VSELQRSVDLERDRFLQALTKRGFRVSDSGEVHGDLVVPPQARAVSLRITLPASFPYGPPVVAPLEGDGGMSWHRDRPGRNDRSGLYPLCLYSDQEDGRPWLDPDAFLDKVRGWFEKDAAGWPDDPPDLDWDRYWPRSGFCLIHPDVSTWEGAQLVANHLRGGCYEVSIGQVVGDGLRARLVNVGEISRPLRTWHDLAEVLGPTADGLEQRIGDLTNPLRVVLVRYSREGLDAVLALMVESTDPIEFTSMEAADASQDILAMRSGVDAPELSTTRVAVVGAGAIGGWTVDLLARAGVGQLTVVDRDWLRPGNGIRHVLGSEYWGLNKATAMKQYLADAAWSFTEVEAIEVGLLAPEMGEELLLGHDVVVDATASGRATPLLWDGSNLLDRPAVFACVQRDGGIVRIDRTPCRSDEQWEPPVPVRDDGPDLQYEGGCGDPVSSTPAWAVTHAASVAAGAAIDIASGRREYPPTIIDVLGAQPDTPYTTIGRLP
jgi:hypothetical protein